MGGRGATLLKKIGGGIDNLNDTGSIEEFKNDEPIDEENLNDLMKELKDNDIIVYKSMNKLPQNILQEQLEAIRDSCKKSKHLVNLINVEKPMEVRLGKFSDPLTQACFRHTHNFDSNKIIFNASLCNVTSEHIKQQTKREQDNGWWVKCDDKNLLKQVATHEFGHFIQYNLIKKMIDRRHKSEYSQLLETYKNQPSKQNQLQIRAFYEKLSFRINNKICLISKDKYGTMNLDDVGEYGKKNQAEWFAEVYTNMSLASKPTNMAKAMKSYLKENKTK